MRRKNWKNPARVYVDSQVFEENIQVYASFEVFLEILEGILYCSKLMKHLQIINTFHTEANNLFGK